MWPVEDEDDEVGDSACCPPLLECAMDRLSFSSVVEVSSDLRRALAREFLRLCAFLTAVVVVFVKTLRLRMASDL